MKIALVVTPNGTGKPPEKTEASEETWNVLLDLLRISEWMTNGASVPPTMRRP